MEFDDVNYHEDDDSDLIQDEYDTTLSQDECPYCCNGCNSCLMTGW